jgi:sec-independent protein translocase protein TatC
MKKPFFDHLKELNYRLMISIGFIVILSSIVYFNYSYFIDFLTKPLIDAGYSVDNIFAITIYEGFQVKITNVLLISLSLLFPLIIINLGNFIKPAIEMGSLSFYLYFIFFTFLYYFGIYSALTISHVGIEFLLSFNENEILLRSQNYFQFIIRISLLFGISFQFPLVILFLLNKNIIKVDNFTKNRPELFIFILILSAVITPTGDPVTLFIFAIPMYLLIELMILLHKKTK